MEWPEELFDADFESDMREVGVGGLRLEATQDALRDYFETFEEFHVEMDELIHADGEHVVNTIRDGGRIRAAMPRSRTATSTSGPSAMARSFGSRSTLSGGGLSKPPGCGSRPVLCFARKAEALLLSHRSRL